VLTLVEHLIGRGHDLRIHDPHISLEQTYGSNRTFALAAVPHLGSLMVPSLDELLHRLRHLMVTQTPPADVAQRLTSLKGRVVDLVGAL
jgi:GDP-mannose 6-dehydrogenase